MSTRATASAIPSPVESPSSPPPGPTSSSISASSASASSSSSSTSSTSSLQVAGGVSVQLLRSLYLGRCAAENGDAGSAALAATGTNSTNSSNRGTRATSLTYPTLRPEFPMVKKLNPLHKKRILVTGGAGFVGSHLVDRLMLMGHDVICVDNFFTGTKANVSNWIGHPHFELIRHDVVDPIMVEVDQIYHLACPASPVHYQSNPVKTLKTGFFGTYNMLGLSKRVKARFLLASTSEVYGSPAEHPQREEYWGHVNPIGPRACYDEGKRVAEALTYSYARQDGVDVRVARIFNTFGPRMNWNDGRVVSNFILQALRGEDITVYGDGSATRSFQYIHDLVDGLIALMESDCTEPVNLGNPDEFTIDGFAATVTGIVQEVQPSTRPKVVHLPPVTDDPQRRRPDISRAAERFGWKPRYSVVEGLRETVLYFKRTLEE